MSREVECGFCAQVALSCARVDGKWIVDEKALYVV